MKSILIHCHKLLMLSCDWFTFTGVSFFFFTQVAPSFVHQLHFYMKLPEPSRMFWKLQGISLSLFLWWLTLEVCGTEVWTCGKRGFSVGKSQCRLSVSMGEIGVNLIWTTRKSDSETCLEVDLQAFIFVNKSCIKFQYYWPFISVHFTVNH